MGYILGIDQGGTKTAAAVMDEAGKILGIATRRVDYYPKDGMVYAFSKIRSTDEHCFSIMSFELLSFPTSKAAAKHSASQDKNAIDSPNVPKNGIRTAPRIRIRARFLATESIAAAFALPILCQNEMIVVLIPFKTMHSEYTAKLSAAVLI